MNLRKIIKTVLVLGVLFAIAAQVVAILSNLDKLPNRNDQIENAVQQIKKAAK